MESIKNINEILFNIKHKLTDMEYLELTKNLLKVYKDKKRTDDLLTNIVQHGNDEIDVLIEVDAQEDENYNWIGDTDTDDSDGEVESYYN